jgi:hypothetical protein
MLISCTPMNGSYKATTSNNSSFCNGHRRSRSQPLCCHVRLVPRLAFVGRDGARMVGWGGGRGVSFFLFFSIERTTVREGARAHPTPPATSMPVGRIFVSTSLSIRSLPPLERSSARRNLASSSGLSSSSLAPRPYSSSLERGKGNVI